MNQEILKKLPCPMDSWDATILSFLKDKPEELSNLDRLLISEMGWLTPEQWGVHLKRLKDNGLILVRVELQTLGKELMDK